MDVRIAMAMGAAWEDVKAVEEPTVVTTVVIVTMAVEKPWEMEPVATMEPV